MIDTEKLVLHKYAENSCVGFVGNGQNTVSIEASDNNLIDRLQLCWNYCAGLSDDELKNGRLAGVK